MIKNIISVEKSNDGKRTYGTDIKGNPLFGRTPAITAQLAAGMFANVVEQMQLKTYDANGELVDLPVEERRNLWIVTAVFPTKQAAIEADKAEELFDAEASAYVASQKSVFAEKHKAAGSLALGVS